MSYAAQLNSCLGAFFSRLPRYWFLGHFLTSFCRTNSLCSLHHHLRFYCVYKTSSRFASMYIRVLAPWPWVRFVHDALDRPFGIDSNFCHAIIRNSLLGCWKRRPPCALARNPCTTLQSKHEKTSSDSKCARCNRHYSLIVSYKHDTFVRTHFCCFPPYDSFNRCQPPHHSRTTQGRRLSLQRLCKRWEKACSPFSLHSRSFPCSVHG